MDSTDSNPLCLECGLCCNGVIFADGQLQPADDAPRLEALGLRLLTHRKSSILRSAITEDGQIANQKFQQPCAAFDGCRCRIYGDRPQYCREFECLTLQRMKAGRLETAAALRVIRAARQRADKVKRLLLQLGDDDKPTALSLRFQRMQKRLESRTTDDETAELFSRLTLAVHDLNLLLSEAFYPGSR